MMSYSIEPHLVIRASLPAVFPSSPTTVADGVESSAASGAAVGTISAASATGGLQTQLMHGTQFATSGDGGR